MNGWVKILTERLYIPAALALAVMFLSAFIEKYPASAGAIAQIEKSRQDEFEIIKTLEALKAHRAALALHGALEAPGSPFRTPGMVKAPGKAGPRAAAPPPPRGFKLTGISGSQSAIILDNKGRSAVVVRGDTLDSAIVVDILNNRVRLKDRAGEFEITIQD